MKRTIILRSHPFGYMEYTEWEDPLPPRLRWGSRVFKRVEGSVTYQEEALPEIHDTRKSFTISLPEPDPELE